MKKLLYVLSSVAFATTLLADYTVDASNTGKNWGTGADNIVYTGNYTVVRNNNNRDLQNKSITVEGYNTKFEIDGYRFGLNNTTIQGTGGNFTVETKNNGWLAFFTDATASTTDKTLAATIDNAKFNFTQNGNNLRAQGNTETNGANLRISLKNSSEVNFTNFSQIYDFNGAESDKVALVFKAENNSGTTSSTINFLGESSVIKNVFFAGNKSDNGAAPLTVNFNTTNTDIKLLYTSTATTSNEVRTTFNADSKNLTVENNTGKVYKATIATFQNFNSLTLQGANHFTFNAASFNGKTLQSKVYINTTTQWTNYNGVRADVIIDKDAKVTFGTNWASAIQGMGKITVNGGGTQSVATLDTNFLIENTTLEINRELEVVSTAGGGTFQKFVMQGTAKLILNADSTINEVITLSNTPTLGIGADITMKNLKFNGNATLTLDFAEGGSLTLTEGLSDFTTGDNILISDTISNSLKIYNLTDDQKKLFSTSVENASVSFADATDASGSYSYVNVVVPEPAQWATIFGAIALGVVVYRRRK